MSGEVWREQWLHKRDPKWLNPIIYPEKAHNFFFGCFIYKMELPAHMDTRGEKQKLVQKIQFPQEVWRSINRFPAISGKLANIKITKNHLYLSGKESGMLSMDWLIWGSLVFWEMYPCMSEYNFGFPNNFLKSFINQKLKPHKQNKICVMTEK